MQLLLSPMSWMIVAAVCLPLAIRMRRWRPLGFTGCALFGLAGLCGAMPLGANLLVATLETKTNAEAKSDCTHVAPSVVVVLAGGADRLPVDEHDFTALSAASLRRLATAVAVWREQPDRTLIIAGGSTFPGTAADSTLMQAFARDLGLPAAAIGIETTSSTTWENARNVASLWPARRIWLVTSALHMRRARFAFAHAGFETCAVRTDPRFVPFGLPGSVLPQAGAATKFEHALHEWVGLAYYHWLAWRDGEMAPAARE